MRCHPETDDTGVAAGKAGVPVKGHEGLLCCMTGRPTKTHRHSQTGTIPNLRMCSIGWGNDVTFAEGYGIETDRHTFAGRRGENRGFSTEDGRGTGEAGGT